MELINQLITFLATPPGNFIYNLAVPAILVGALHGAVSQWRATGYPQSRRMMQGLGLALAGQVFLLLLGILMYQKIVPGLGILPVLDRAVILFSLIWIFWVWAFPEPSRPGDAAAIILSLLLLAALLFGAVDRSAAPAAANAFNASMQSILWSVGGLALMVLGGLALLFRKPEGWGTGLTVAALGLLGFALDLFLTPAQGDFSGTVRFLLLAGYPLLLTLPMRFPMPVNLPRTHTVATYQEKVAEWKQQAASGEQPSQPIRERRRYSTDPKTLQSLLTLAAETDPTSISQYIARSVAQAMLADLCFLLYLGEDKGSIFIATGYDLIREENLEGGLIKKDDVPMLANAVLRGRALRLPASTTSSDLKGLGDMLGLAHAGNLLNVPINSEKGIVGSILLLSPYSNRVWSADDQTFLANIASSFVSIVERGKRIAELQMERERARHSAEDAQSQLVRLQATNADLNSQVETMKSQAEQAVRLTAERNEASAQLDALKAENQRLQGHLTALSNGASPPPAANEQLENELRMTLREMARLQNALAESNMKILELENRPTGSASLTNDQAEVIASISQELRQPMSSIIGYADLLLGESVGILGALQRKFIERIRASTERIGSLIDDLIQITTLETGLMSLKPESVDMNLIIDNAMAYTSSQLREKNITLRIDIPDNMQPIQTDREALQQILIHLLQNAGAASSVEGAVTLRARTQKENENEHALIQVTDTGGGIPSEDLPRVFSRLYRADNVLIQGVGDTGVGLSIAKALTEAQGGRIWVDTEMGSGSTFSVLLPLKHPADTKG